VQNRSVPFVQTCSTCVLSLRYGLPWWLWVRELSKSARCALAWRATSPDLLDVRGRCGVGARCPKLPGVRRTVRAPASSGWGVGRALVQKCPTCASTYARPMAPRAVQNCTCGAAVCLNPEMISENDLL